MRNAANDRGDDIFVILDTNVEIMPSTLEFRVTLSTALSPESKRKILHSRFCDLANAFVDRIDHNSMYIDTLSIVLMLSFFVL